MDQTVRTIWQEADRKMLYSRLKRFKLHKPLKPWYFSQSTEFKIHKSNYVDADYNIGKALKWSGVLVDFRFDFQLIKVYGHQYENIDIKHSRELSVLYWWERNLVFKFRGS